LENREAEAYIGVRVPRSLKQLVTRIVEVDTHINKSEFVRAAIREKISRDAPQLYRTLYRAV
jgi:Arc/MetJ-type ribon-helix-helix transcriptional regulator